MGFKPRPSREETKGPPLPPKPFRMSTPKRKRGVGYYDESDSDCGVELPLAKRGPPPVPAYAPVKVGGQNKGRSVMITCEECDCSPNVPYTASTVSGRGSGGLCAPDKSLAPGFNLPADGWGSLRASNGQGELG
jgi:hypothetical protein